MKKQRQQQLVKIEWKKTPKNIATNFSRKTKGFGKFTKKQVHLLISSLKSIIIEGKSGF